MEIVKQMESVLGTGLASVLCALLLAIVAFLLANLAQEGCAGFCRRWEEKIGGDSVEMLGRLAYLVVLLLFAPGIFERLGAGSVTAPIFHTMEKIFSFIPDLIGAGLIFAIGMCVAKMLRNIVRPVLQKTKVDATFTKLMANDEVKVSDTVSYLVYVLVMIPVCIASLEALHIHSLTQPAVKVLNKCLLFIPDIVAAVLLATIGIFLARFLSRFVEQFVSVSGIDVYIRKITGQETFTLSHVIGVFVNIIVTLFFIVESVNQLHLPILSRIGNAVIGYLPNILGTMFILALAMFASYAVRHHFGKCCCSATVSFTTAFIYLIAVFMGLSQLHIGTHILNTLFTAMMIGICIAFAIAFGLGGREFAARVLDRYAKGGNAVSEKKEEEANSASLDDTLAGQETMLGKNEQEKETSVI